MNFQVQEKTVFFLNRLFYNPLILLSINLSPIALGETMLEWGGALRWLKTELSQDKIREVNDSINGHISLFRTSNKRDKAFQPLLPKHLLQLHRKLKHAFDPHGIFNIGRMYQEF
jgi:glycolate oxidase FAD binding subunit